VRALPRAALLITCAASIATAQSATEGDFDSVVASYVAEGLRGNLALQGQALEVEKAAQAAVARAVVDSVESGVIPKDQADDLCILVGVFIHWEASDDKKIYDYNYQATKESIARALGRKPSVADVLAGAKSAKHPFSPK
jgi:formaldehyde-activating enzyme involved in methanogenesis